MAYPVILIDSASGSDSAASGAGPSTALTGTLASTDGGGTTVTLDALTDTSGVATDGSAVIFLNDTTAGHRNFAKITAKAGSGGATPTVTVAEAFTGSLAAKTWAIGGKRATLAGAVSLRLIDNNSGDGDAMPGWTMACQSGHTEAITVRLEARRAGDATDGYITIRGPVSGTMPVLTWNTTLQGILCFASFWEIANLDMRQINASPGGDSAAVWFVSGGGLATNLRINDAGNYWTRGVNNGASTSAVRSCDIAYTSLGIVSGSRGLLVDGCYLHDNTSHGIHYQGDLYHPLAILNTICAGNGGDGCKVDKADDFDNSHRLWLVDRCVFYGNTGDGMACGLATPTLLSNCLFVGNGGYGLQLEQASAAAAAVYRPAFLNLGFFNNTSGAYRPTGLVAAGILVNEPTVTGDPFTNAAAGDFSLNTTAGAGAACRAAGFPGVFPGATTTSYPDIGAAQHQDTGGGGGGGLRPVGVGGLAG